MLFECGITVFVNVADEDRLENVPEDGLLVGVDLDVNNIVEDGDDTKKYKWPFIA